MKPIEQGRREGLFELMGRRQTLFIFEQNRDSIAEAFQEAPLVNKVPDTEKAS